MPASYTGTASIYVKCLWGTDTQINARPYPLELTQNPKLMVTFTAATGGALTGTTVQTGESGFSTTPVTAVPREGWSFVNWTLAGASYSTNNPLTVNNVTSNMVLQANFATTYAVAFSTSYGGTLTGAVNQTVVSGHSATPVTAVPNTGYHFVCWARNGATYSTDNPLTIANVTADISIVAYFQLNTYALTFTAGKNGTLTGNTSQTVNYGYSSSAVTAVPGTGWCFRDWTLDGAVYSTNNPLAIHPVQRDIALQANFSDTCSVSFSAGPGGSITGATLQTGKVGFDTTSVTAVASAGYHFIAWTNWVNGQPEQYSKNTTLAIADVQGSMKLSAAFSQLTNDNWVGMGGVPGVEGKVNATVWHNGMLYIAGVFTTAGGVAANGVAKWDGERWSPLGEGVDDEVYALACDASGNLYAGGGFTTAGGVAANGVAKWDGERWSPLGDGVDGEVYALACDASGNLYAGGGFTTAGGVAANGVAKWDGERWSPLDEGVDGGVYTLACDASGNLYGEGYFTTVGGVVAYGVAKWDGERWSPLGEGIDDYVYALACDASGNLYAGGYFTAAGGVAANGVAKWDGEKWSPLGEGVNGSVSTLAIDASGNLYAGGYFTTAGGVGRQPCRQMGRREVESARRGH